MYGLSTGWNSHLANRQLPNHCHPGSIRHAAGVLSVSTDIATGSLTTVGDSLPAEENGAVSDDVFFRCK